MPLNVLKIAKNWKTKNLLESAEAMGVCSNVASEETMKLATNADFAALYLCTKSPGGMENTEFYTIPKMEAKTQENKKKANDIFFNSQPYMFDVDNRCWQPRSKRY